MTASPILQQGCSIQCPHGGMVAVVPQNARLKVGGALALTVADTFTVAGCAFTLPGPKPSPCVQVQWVAEAVRVSASGKKVLLASSQGLCKSAEGAVQGTAIVAGVQTRAQGA